VDQDSTVPDTTGDVASKDFSSDKYLQTTYANYLVLGSAVFSLAYAAYCYWTLTKIEMTADTIKVAKLSERERDEIMAMQHRKLPPQTQQEALDMMLKISELIRTGSNEFLKKEYTYLAVFCVPFACLVYFAVDYQEAMGEARYLPYTTFAFFVGAITSMLCGYIGMSVATYTNVRTTWACNTSIHDGFHVAFKGGKVLGFCLVGLAILVL